MSGLHLVRAVVLAVEEGGETAPSSGPEAFGIGSVVLLVAAVAVLGWMAYLVVNTRRSRRAAPDVTPANLQPYLSDDELESRRITNVLRAALFGAGLLAIVLPWYAFNEPGRQAEAAEEQAILDIEEGERWYTAFSCFQCHGVDLGGGTAEFIEPRSGVEVGWLAPSLDDVFFRYDAEEVRTVIVHGRPGTPMPANGLEGGGAMTEQEVDQVMAYILANQVSQADVVSAVDAAVDQALNRLGLAGERLDDLIRIQQAQIDDVLAADERIAVVGDLPDEIADLLAADGTCTDRSAALVQSRCGSPGADSDRDGLTDAAEEALTGYAELALANLPVLTVEGRYAANPAYQVTFDPGNRFTNGAEAGTPLPDLDAAVTLLEAVQTDVLLTSVAADREEQFLADLVPGLEFLETAAELRLWEIDLVEVKREMNEQQAADHEFGLQDTPEDEEPPPRFLVGGNDAERAVGLFHAYCARCHTGGWSAGAPFVTGHGTGAWGPSLIGGRSIIQFPNWMDQVDFVSEGSEFHVNYGVNGLGTGRMPGFGQVLTERDLQLIVIFERTL